MVLIVQVWVSLFVGLMCIVWVAAVVLPFVFLEGKAARPAEGPSVTDVLQVQNLQEAGFLYSYYPRYSEKESAYRFDLAYPFTLLATYVIGLLVLVRYSLKGFPAFHLQDKKAAPGFLSLFGLFSIDRKNQKKFSNATFSSWNFNLVSIETSRQYRRGMRQKFQIMLQEAALEKNKVDIQMFKPSRARTSCSSSRVYWFGPSWSGPLPSASITSSRRWNPSRTASGSSMPPPWPSGRS